MLQKKLITLTLRIFLRKVFQNITSYCKLCKYTLFLSNKKRIFIGKSASTAFRNLRNKYSRENKKLKALHESICNELEVVTDIFISHMARTFCLKERLFQIMKRIKKSNLKMTKSQQKTLMAMTSFLFWFKKAGLFLLRYRNKIAS